MIEKYPAWPPAAVLGLTPAQAMAFLAGVEWGTPAGSADKAHGDPRFPGKRVVTVASLAEYRQKYGS